MSFKTTFALSIFLCSIFFLDLGPAFASSNAPNFCKLEITGEVTIRNKWEDQIQTSHVHFEDLDPDSCLEKGISLLERDSLPYGIVNVRFRGKQPRSMHPLEIHVRASSLQDRYDIILKKTYLPYPTSFLGACNQLVRDFLNRKQKNPSCKIAYLRNQSREQETIPITDAFRCLEEGLLISKRSDASSIQIYALDEAIEIKALFQNQNI